MGFASYLKRWWSDRTDAGWFRTLSLEERTLMARDIGISEQALRDLVAQNPEAGAEMPRLLQALSLDPKMIRRQHPEVLGDMSVTCSACQSVTECRHHLEEGTAGQTFQRYCPNAQTMVALEKERWHRREQELRQLVKD